MKLDANVIPPRLYLYRRIVQAKLYIDQRYSEKLDLRNIAGEASFSKFHFIRLFKEIYGKTPHHYLTQVRLDHARQMLAGKNPVSEVCAAVGFDSVTSFTALFKKSTGLTPSAFQRAQLKRTDQMQEHPLRFVPNCFLKIHGWV